MTKTPLSWAQAARRVMADARRIEARRIALAVREGARSQALDNAPHREVIDD